MQIEFTSEEMAFRAEARCWLRANVPAGERPIHSDRALDIREFDLEWQRKQFEAGWAGISWPSEYGGRGVSLIEQLIWHEEYARAGAPRAGSCFVGLSHAGPTLIARGTPEQQAFHLPRILRGDTVWCQGFSEPGAGSDLAALGTRAEIDGDDLVVNGAKIWTSYAAIADYQELLCRTEAGGRKHSGISWVICPMDTPGIELRPILTMVGPNDFHFCQVFYNDVRIPLANVVGEVNDGWNVANATLGFERGTGFVADQIQNSELVERLIAMARGRCGLDGLSPAIDDGDFASRLAMSRAEMAGVRAMTYATVSRAANANPGPEGSLVKLFFSEASQRLRRLGVDLLGPEALELSSDAGLTTPYLRSYAASIGGGTSDVQRNIIAERVLGLPRAPRP
jgi:alkylation response protein AidB-like acyl-CoA dehydrogenase